MFAKALVLFAVTTQALAGVFITSPTAATTFSGGSRATISWIESSSGPTLKEFGPSRVSIYAGNAREQTSLKLIEDSVDVSTTSSIVFDVDPTTGPDSAEYFIRIESLSLRDPDMPQYPALAFSAKFRMDKMTGTFSPQVLAQIAGQTTAPLNPTGSPAVPSTSSGTVRAGASTSASRSSSAVRPSGTGAAGDDEEDGALANTVGFAGLILTALATIALI